MLWSEAASGVVILGTARSGTSAIASMFASAGFHAGPPSALMRPNYANPRGYFERTEIVELNDAVLDAADATWFRPPALGSGWEPSAADRERARNALEALRAEAGRKPMVVKDHRICALLDLWLPLLVDEFAPVLAVRDPVEVAASLNKRDGSPLPFALAAWELVLTHLLPSLQEARVTVAPYAALGLPGVAERVIADAASGLDSERRRELNPAAAATAFDPAGRHHVAGATEFPHAELLTTRQLALWRWLEALEPGTQRLDVPDAFLGARPSAWAIVEEERRRREIVQRTAVLENLLPSHEREIERLKALVFSEQARLQEQLDAANAALGEQEERHTSEVAQLRALIRSEQERLEAEIRELQEAAIARARS